MEIYSLKLIWDRVLKYKWRHIGKRKEAQNWFVRFCLWVPFINCSVYSCFSCYGPHRKLFRMCLDKDGILAQTYPIHNSVSLNQTQGKRIVEGWASLTKVASAWWENWVEIKTRCIWHEDNGSMWKRFFFSVILNTVLCVCNQVQSRCEKP